MRAAWVATLAVLAFAVPAAAPSRSAAATAPSLSVAPLPGAVATARPRVEGVAGTAPDDEPTVTIAFFPDAGPPISFTAPVGAGGAFAAAPPQDIPDGLYTLLVAQADTDGDVSTSDPQTVLIDTVAPAVSLALPAVTRVRTQPFSGSGGVAPGDAPQMTVTIRAGEAVVSRYTLSAGALHAQLPLVSDGVYTVTLSQTDEAGNVGVASRSVLVDTTRPVIDRAALPHRYLLGATVPTPPGICRDDASGIASCDAPATLDTSATGLHSIKVTAVDRAGKSASGYVSYWVGRAPGPRLAIVSATARRHGHAITVRARGTIDPQVTRPLLVAAGGRRVSVPVAGGAWRATIRLRSHARKVELKLVYGGDATHRAGRGHRSIRVR